MSPFKVIANWDNLPLSTVLYGLQRYFSVTTETEICEHACQTGIWVGIRIRYEGKKYGVGGSSLDIAKKRLLEWVDTHRIRDEFLTKK